MGPTEPNTAAFQSMTRKTNFNNIGKGGGMAPVPGNQDIRLGLKNR